jgi:hypothetical protein
VFFIVQRYFDPVVDFLLPVLGRSVEGEKQEKQVGQVSQKDGI